MALIVGAISSAAMAGSLLQQVNASVYQGDWGFAIDANIEVGTSEPAACKLKDMVCFIAAEESTGNVYIYPFSNREVALNMSKTYWSGNVVFGLDGKELGGGGLGISRNTCRRNGLRWLAQHLQKIAGK